MRTVLRVCFAAALVAALGSVAVAGDDDWGEYKSDDYGFSMKVPKGTKFVEKEKEDGWGFLHAEHEGVEFFALAKLDVQATAEEIEKIGAKVSKIEDKHWKKVDEGKDHNGWKWWKTAEASDGKKIVFAGYGTGAKGSYLCFLKTTVEDYEKHKADYKKWYESVKLS